MTDAKVVALHPDSPLAAVGRRVLAQLPALIPAMGLAYQREVAEYAALPTEQFEHVLVTSGAFVGAFAEMLRDGVDAPVPDHARLVAAGRQRQSIGVSMDAAMHAFRIASREGWTAMADAAAEVDPRLVGALASRWIEYADRAATAFAEGHARAATEQLRRVDARRQALVADLLAAQDPVTARSIGAQHGLNLASAYIPLLLLGTDFAHADALAAELGEDVLLGHRGDRLLVLVPGRDLPEAVARVAASHLVAAGSAAALGAELVAEVAAVESTVGAALATGRHRGLVRPRDLVLERAVREHAGLRAHLDEQILAALQAADADGIFLATLRAYLALGSVPRAAQQLFVHANTVTYRLRRVHEITGLDPRVPNDAAVLVLALALQGGIP